ncbi:hypothetical protein ACFO0U_01655 [Chromohalobacter sarecensis]|uniref:Uncharacterized protein n=1 Tax=Chromohalobacter sarecensis TaxID=245294 RepID=A0ABV9CXP2_9GAMM|nr:hypothetical protein [Chromohalobacter sarecensis]MCK0715533.1 hypothetical protein [Chromohalobacter sarecensis]
MARLPEGTWAADETHLQVAQRVKGDAAREAVSHAEQGAARLATTLDQLLALARIEGARARHETEDGASVADIVRSAVRDTQASARIDVPATLPDAYVGVPLELATDDQGRGEPMTARIFSSSGIPCATSSLPS